MSFSKMPGRLRMSAAVLAAVVLCGCFEYTEEIDIQADGSGVVTISGWIDAGVAERFKTVDEEDSEPISPIRRGTINALTTGSANVDLDESVFELDALAHRWNFRYTLYFDSIRALANVKFFEGRNLSLRHPSLREVRFKAGITPSLVEMAVARAQSAAMENDAYAPGFLAASKTPDFQNLFSDTKLTYIVTMAAETATGAPEISTLPGNRVRCTWQYTMKDLAGDEAPPALLIDAMLPAEGGFRGFVTLVLLASVVGILIPAIRLVITKIQGTS